MKRLVRWTFSSTQIYYLRRRPGSLDKVDSSIYWWATTPREGVSMSKEDVDAVAKIVRRGLARWFANLDKEVRVVRLVPKSRVALKDVVVKAAIAVVARIETADRREKKGDRRDGDAVVAAFMDLTDACCAYLKAETKGKKG